MSSSSTSTGTGPSQRNWRRASRCSSSGCVEVAISSHEIAVRDSKDAGSPVLVFDHEEWRIFMEAAKAGEFDTATEPATV